MHRFPDHQGKLYTAEIVLAFSYLHGLNIVYRDLKPEVRQMTHKTCLPAVRNNYNIPTRQHGVRVWVQFSMRNVNRLLKCNRDSIFYRTAEQCAALLLYYLHRGHRSCPTQLCVRRLCYIYSVQPLPVSVQQAFVLWKRCVVVSIDASSILAYRVYANGSPFRCLPKRFAQNLLITREGRIKVTDFGFAKVVEDR